MSMIVRQNIVLIIVALFTFSNSAVATNQSAEEKNQTSLITDSAQQVVQPSKHSILKGKKSEQPESTKPIKPNMADYCRKHTC